MTRAARHRPALFPADPGRRMRLVAGALLVIMAGLFVVARHLATRQPAWGYAAAFAEAAMVEMPPID